MTSKLIERMNTIKVKVNQRFTNRRPKMSWNATINKSLLHKLNPANLYRFFCLSLFRNDYYNVRIRLKDLANITGEKVTALNRFNKDILDIIHQKKYYQDINHPVYKAKRTSYHIPPIEREKEFITLSSRLTEIKVNPKVKGYYIKLLLIADNSIINLSPKQIALKLEMGRAIVEDYNVELYKLGLLRYLPKGVELTPDDLLIDNSYAIQMKHWNNTPQNPLPNITLKSKK